MRLRLRRRRSRRRLVLSAASTRRKKHEAVSKSNPLRHSVPLLPWLLPIALLCLWRGHGHNSFMARQPHVDQESSRSNHK
jgi:hypothetical protein